MCYKVSPFSVFRFFPIFDIHFGKIWTKNTGFIQYPVWCSTKMRNGHSRIFHYFFFDAWPLYFIRVLGRTCKYKAFIKRIFFRKTENTVKNWPFHVHISCIFSIFWVHIYAHIFGFLACILSALYLLYGLIKVQSYS